MVPTGVQTGCANGCREREQKLKGRRLKGALPPPRLALPTPAPALAEKASSDAHSECVIYIGWLLGRIRQCDGGEFCEEGGAGLNHVRRAYRFLEINEIN